MTCQPSLASSNMLTRLTVLRKPRHGNDLGQYRPMQLCEVSFGAKSVTWCDMCFYMRCIVIKLLSLVDTCYKHVQTATPMSMLLGCVSRKRAVRSGRPFFQMVTIIARKIIKIYQNTIHMETYNLTCTTKCCK